MHRLVEGFLNLLFPPRCQVCRRFVKALICPDCAAEIVPLAPPFCRICGEPFDPLARGGDLCAECRPGKQPFDRARAFAPYEGALREAIHRLKYLGMRPLAVPLAEMAAACFDHAAPGDPPPLMASEMDLICPVPLHPGRQRLRGFNQSELIARRLGERLGLPLNAVALRRARATPPQVALTAEQRCRNVRGAFAVEDKAAVAGKSVLVLDDVWTTGSTITECAKVLRRAGAARVFALTVARRVAY